VIAQFAGWPTPDTGLNTTDANWQERRQIAKAKHGNNGFGLTLGMAVDLVGWPTATQRDGASSRNATAGRSANAKFNTGTTLTDAADMVLTGWPTARSTDGEKNVRSPEGAMREMERKGSPQDLCQAANLIGWSTPSSRDWKDTAGMATTAVNPDGSTRTRLDQLPRQAQLARGLPSTSSTAPTAKRAASLNPRFSGWLMGFPESWCTAALRVPKASRSRRKPATGSDACAATETPSTPTPRRKSSARGEK
jgi:hypothetical protein